MSKETTQTPAELMPTIVEPSALESLARADYDVAIATAKRYPMHGDARGIERFQAEAIALATSSKEVAEACLYTLPRADGVIEGSSVRLAEIAASCFGNIRAASRIIEIGREEVRAQGVCHDLERNVYISTEIGRRITTKDGRRFSADMIGVTANAAASIAIRTAIFKVIPAALVEPIYKAARKAAVGDIATLAIRRPHALRKFALMGVTTERVLARLGRQAISEITAEDLTTLAGFYNAIQAHETTPDEAFPLPINEKPGTGGLVERLKGTSKARPDAPKPPKDESPPPAEETPQQTPEPTETPLPDTVLLDSGASFPLAVVCDALWGHARAKGYSRPRLEKEVRDYGAEEVARGFGLEAVGLAQKIAELQALSKEAAK